MDQNFPKWLRLVVNKLSFLAVPNIGGILAGVAVFSFLMNMTSPASMSQFLFDPVAIIYGGEWWRCFTFPFLAGFDSPLGVIFYCLFTYYILGILESHWGAGPLTVYLLFSYLCAMAGSLIALYPINLTTYMLQNISLAVGTLLPNLEFYIYFLFPVKAKWLAMFSGALLIVQFINPPVAQMRIVLGFAFIPYLLFFVPLGIRTARNSWKIRKNRRKFDQSMWR